MAARLKALKMSKFPGLATGRSWRVGRRVAGAKGLVSLSGGGPIDKLRGMFEEEATIVLRGSLDAGKEGSFVIGLLMFCLAAAQEQPVEGPGQAEWLRARCELRPSPEGQGVWVDYSLPAENRSVAWFRRAWPEDQDLRGFRYLRFEVSGGGPGIKLQMHLIGFVAGEEQAFGSLPIPLDAAAPQTFSIDLRSLRRGLPIPEEDLARVRQLNFAVVATAPGSGHIYLEDCAFTNEAAGHIVEVPKSHARLRSEEDFVAAIDWPEGVERSAAGFGAWVAAREKPVYFFDGRGSEALLAAIEQQQPGWAAKLQREADERVMRRHFIFEADERQLADPIEWDQGPVEWTHILHRLQYLRPLWAAYWYTGDEKYAQDAVRILNDWIDHNPAPELLDVPGGTHGYGWRSLETGIRCDTVPQAFFALLGSPSFSAAGRAKVVRSLAEQARYLAAFQESYGYRPGNFQVVECAGLATIGMLFPKFKEAASWRAIALKWLGEHMARDVYEDGTHWEATPGYHGWVAERFSTVWRLAALNGRTIDSAITEKLRRMYAFDLKIMTPTGHTPMNGDCGRYSVATRLARGALLFDDPVLRFGAGDSLPVEHLLMFGPEAAKIFARMPREEPPFTSVLLPDSGYGIMRSGWGQDDAYFCFDMVPYGGGHSHPDQLSFELQQGPLLVFGDSGRLNYNHPLHYGYFRTHRAHNICLVDGEGAAREQSPERLEWQDQAGFLVARGRIRIGEHSWERGVLWRKPDLWLIRDLFRGEGAHTVERLFNQAPAYPGNLPDEAERLRIGPADPADWLEVQDGRRRNEEGHFGISASTQYPAKTIVVESKVDFPAMLWCAVGARVQGGAVQAEDTGIDHLEVRIRRGEEVEVVRWEWPEGPGDSAVTISPVPTP